MMTKVIWLIPLVFLRIRFVEGWVVSPSSGVVSDSVFSQWVIRRRSSTALNVVFTKLSEDCLAALQVAQETASSLQQSTVDEPCLLLGICHHPGRCQSTLQQYDITSENIARILNYLKPESYVPKLSDFSTQPVELPYAASLQRTLFQAGTISASCGATNICPEHVLLSLLQYQEIDGEAHAATRSDDCPAMETIYHLDATLEGEDICSTLLQNLMQSQSLVSDAASGNKLVSSTNTKVGAPAGRSETEEKSNESILEECSIDLTALAANGELDKVHGRDAELQACFQTLVRRRKNNVCLVGEAGVGKTAIAEGLAQILVSEEQCPMILKGYRMVSLQVAALLAGTKYRGEFEGRLRSIIEELTTNSNRTRTILFVDEIHTLVGAGSTGDGSMDASNLLKPYLARGQLQVVGATTVAEYNKYIAKDAALERRFQPVMVEEPSVEATVGILQALLPTYRAHHRVEFTDAALQAAARLSDRYINDRFLPDKALDLIDEAGALATLTRNPNDLEPPQVTEREITDIISQWTNIPVGRLELDEMSKLRGLEENLARRVKGQERAVKSVAKAIRRARTGIRNPRRPIASFLFCGTTGTGPSQGFFCYTGGWL